MKTAACTLFEGQHHLGLAALVNSLHAHGFRGTLWAGYRGALPPWVRGLVEGRIFSEMKLPGGGAIRFMALATEAHLTNYKAAFMLEVMEGYDTEAEALCYFDPDVVVAGRWSFFEEWVACGVALCEDVNSPMPETHPTRAAWRNFCGARGLPLRPRTSSYVNGGFAGVARPHLAFLRHWGDILEWMKEEIGTAGNFNWTDKDRTYPFYRNDQDALNMAVEAGDIPLSIVGKEGMSFTSGGYIMYHALGQPKPWTKNYVWEALKGWPPTAAEMAFLRYSEGPVSAYTAGELAGKRRALWLAGAICRFVRKRGW